MGRLINESLLQEKLALIPMEERTFRRTVEELENAPTVEAIPKADYEEQIKINNKLVKDNKQLKAYITMMQIDYKARLKADMVAMLTDIQLEIEENYNSCMRAKSVEIIQQKINKLRGEEK